MGRIDIGVSEGKRTRDRVQLDPTMIPGPTDERRVSAQLSRDEWGVLLGLGVGLPTGSVLLWVFLTDSLSTGIGILMTCMLPVFIAGAAFVIIGQQHVSTLGLTSGGVHVRSWFGWKEALWATVRPGIVYTKSGFFQIRIRSAKGELSRTYNLSKDQARALLTHPAAPAALFPPEAWELVGLPAPKASPPAPLP